MNFIPSLILNHMVSTSILKLKDRILRDLGLVVYDDVLNLLGTDRSKAVKLLASLIEDSVSEYCRYFPLVLDVTLTGVLRHTFIDNFDSYLDETIGEEYIVLVPTGIVSVGTRFIASYYWEYRKPVLVAKRGISLTGKVSYFAQYPIKYTITNDNDFSEDSKIYGLDLLANIDFLAFINLKVAETIQSIINSVDINSPIKILPNLGDKISEFRDKINNEILDRQSHILQMWRK